MMKVMIIATILAMPVVGFFGDMNYGKKKRDKPEELFDSEELI